MRALSLLQRARARRGLASLAGSKFELEMLAPALGAEVRGLDLSRPLCDETSAKLRSARLEHEVLLRGQRLSPRSEAESRRARRL